MKRITASEARRQWFRILDEVAAGEIVVVERAGRRIVLRREEAPDEDAGVPDYSGLLRVPQADRAHEWSWRWPGEEGELEPE